MILIKRWYGFITFFIIILSFLLLGYFKGRIDEQKHHEIQQVEKVATRDINFLLNKEGYKIYFRITEEGQLSLVHPK